MTQYLQVIDPTTYQAWDDLLLTSSGASFFHSAAWAKVLAKSYGYKPVYFATIDGGRLRTLIALMDVG